MFKMKKTMVTLLSFVLCLATISTTPAMAAGASMAEESEIMPLMEYINDADYDFYISGGKAEMYAVVYGQYPAATKCEVTVELQEKGILRWSTVETWTSSESGRSAELDISYTVTSGKSYRMITTVTVWSGNASESKTMTSDTLKA